VAVAGERRSPDRFAELTEGLAELIEAARGTSPDGPAKGFVRIAGDVHFVAALVIAPLKKGFASRDPEAPSVLLLARRISPEFLTGLAESTPLGNLRLVASDPEPPAPFLSIAAPDGAIIGNLVWDAERPGNEMLRKLAPGGGILVILLAAAGVLFFHDVKATNAVLTEGRKAFTEGKQAEESLLASQRTLRGLTMKLSTVEERERRRFATYLHDQIGQALALLQIKCGALAAAPHARPFRRSIAEIRDLLERVIEDTHSLVFDLSPPVLHELGLGPAVEQVGEQICTANGLRFDFEDDGCAKLLDADLAVRLFRSARELLMNVVKHARANHIRVTLRRTGDEMRIAVEDDGVGFDTAITEPRVGAKEFGLFSIREHLRLVGGRLEIESRPGRTRAGLVVPLPPRRTADESLS
jgi:signal transduction histidine kinase